MFDSPPTSWFSILFLSAVFLKSCGLPPEGKRIEDQDGQQAQQEADASERESSPARWGGAQVQYISSEASPPPPVLLGGGSWTWPSCDGLAPWASTACQHTTPNSLKKKKNIIHCLLQPQGSQAVTNFLCFFGVLYAYIYEYEYIVRMCTNVGVSFFFIMLWNVCQVLLGILIFLLPYTLLS